MNETQKREPTMEALREAVAAELRRITPPESRSESVTAEPPRPKENGEAERIPFFRRAETLSQLVEAFGELKENVDAVERELMRLREELAEVRAQAEDRENELRRENRALRQELQTLRDTDALIHMRVFDNRVRISEVKEALEEAKA